MLARAMICITHVMRRAKNTVDGRKGEGKGLGSLKFLTTHDLTRKHVFSLLGAMNRPVKYGKSS